MGIMSNTTMDKSNIETKVTPFDSIKEIFAKSFCDIFSKGKETQGETLTVKDKEISIAGKKIELQKEGQFLLNSNYDPSKYLGDSRAYQCNPGEHLVRNMSPVELQNFLKGETIAPIDIIQRAVYNDKHQGSFCFSPETPVYLGDKLSNTHQRMGYFVAPVSIDNVRATQMPQGYDNRYLISQFPVIENIQVVFKIEDRSIYEHIEPQCAARFGLDPCFGGLDTFAENQQYVYKPDNFDCEIRLPEYNDKMLSIIAIDGIDVRDMSIGEKETLVWEMVLTRQDGLSSDDFLSQHPEYDSYYDRSNIIEEKDYIKEYQENDREYLNGDDYSYLSSKIENMEQFNDWEDY